MISWLLKALKGLMKKHVCGKFHQYSICGCRVKNFQSFAYQLSIHEMAVLGVFLGPYSSRYGPILLKFSTELLFREIISVFIQCLNNPSKMWMFTEIGHTQSLQFWFNFYIDSLPPFPTEEGQNKKYIYFQGKTLAIGLSKCD